MFDPREADHVVGVELQLEELVEQRERARVQGREEDARALDWQIDEFYQELADVTEAMIEKAATQAVLHAEHPAQPPQSSQWPPLAPPAA